MVHRGTGRASNPFIAFMVVFAILLAGIVAVLWWLEGAQRRQHPRLPATTTTTPATASQSPVAAPKTWTGYQGTGYPGCVHEDGSGVGAGPCVLDCDSLTMDQWCRHDQRGLWLRWPEQRQPDRPVRLGG